MIQEIIKTETVLGKVLHVYGTPEDPLFIAKNVADWIGHTHTTHMTSGLDDDEKLHVQILHAGQQQRKVLMVTEFGLYEILMQSSKPVAKAFKKAVKRILHELRTHGMTATPQKLDEILRDPDRFIKLLQEYKEKSAAKELAEQKVKTSNLEEVIAKENIQHFFANGLQKRFPNRGIKPIPVNVYDYKTGELKSTHPSMTDAAILYELNLGSISSILAGKSKQTKGLTFSKA